MEKILARKRFFNLKKSMELNDIIIEEIDSEEMEITVPTDEEIKFAKTFGYVPVAVASERERLAGSCVRKKLLAEDGFGRYSRGSQWLAFCKYR